MNLPPPPPPPAERFVPSSSSPPPPPPPPPVSPSPAAPYGYEAWQADNLRRAGFWRRLVSLALDGVFYGLALAAALIPAALMGAIALDDCTSIDGEVVCPDGAVRAGPLVAAVLLGVLAVVGIAGIYLRSLGRRGTTWGRTIVKIRVVDISTGEPIGIPRALGRTLFANLVSANVFYLGYLWMLWDKDRQTWHDKLTRSTVVRT